MACPRSRKFSAGCGSMHKSPPSSSTTRLLGPAGGPFIPSRSHLRYHNTFTPAISISSCSRESKYIEGICIDPRPCSVLNMSSERKAILTSGLGGFAAKDPNAQAVFGPNAGAKAQELLQITTEKANAAGFDLVRCDANTQDPEDTLKRFTETLQSRKFAGVNIGYGLRGHKGTFSRDEFLVGVRIDLCRY